MQEELMEMPTIQELIEESVVLVHHVVHALYRDIASHAGVANLPKIHISTDMGMRATATYRAGQDLIILSATTCRTRMWSTSPMY